jgi:hypothetical protein
MNMALSAASSNVCTIQDSPDFRKAIGRVFQALKRAVPSCMLRVLPPEPNRLATPDCSLVPGTGFLWVGHVSLCALHVFCQPETVVCSCVSRIDSEDNPSGPSHCEQYSESGVRTPIRTGWQSITPDLDMARERNWKGHDQSCSDIRKHCWICTGFD